MPGFRPSLKGRELIRSSMDEEGITVPYLARIAGVSAQMVWKDVNLLKSMLEKDTLQEVKP